MSIFLELFQKNPFLTIYIHISKARNSLKSCSIHQIFFLQVQNIPIKSFVLCVVFRCQYFWSYSRKTHFRCSSRICEDIFTALPIFRKPRFERMRAYKHITTFRKLPNGRSGLTVFDDLRESIHISDHSFKCFGVSI